MDSFGGLFLEAEKPTQQIIGQKRRPWGASDMAHGDQTPGLVPKEQLGEHFHLYGLCGPKIKFCHSVFS